MADKPLLCAAIMVKNEASTIMHTLNSLKDIIEKIVLLDTGSTDDTKSIVANFCKENNIKLKMEDKPWVNFSVNRNKLLDMCRGEAEFSLLLDSNEQVRNLKTVYPFLKRMKKERKVGLFSVKYLLDNDNGIIGNARTFYRPIIIRNNGCVEYKYPVHEMLMPVKECQFNNELESSEFMIYQDRRTDKSSVPRIRDSDIPTLLNYIREHGEESRTIRYLCQSYDVIADYENLYKWTSKLISKYYNPKQYDDSIYYGYLWYARSAAMTGHSDYHKIYMDAYKYTTIVRPNPEPLYEGAQMCLKNNDNLRAYVFISMCCALERPTSDIPGIMVNYQIYDKLRWLLLYVISAKLSKIEEAMKAIKIFKQLGFLIVEINENHDAILIKASDLGIPSIEAIPDGSLLMNQLPLQVQDAIKSGLEQSMSNTEKEVIAQKQKKEQEQEQDQVQDLAQNLVQDQVQDQVQEQILNRVEDITVKTDTVNIVEDEEPEPTLIL